MTDTQKLIKYVAIALAICLIITIFSGIAGALGIFTLIFDGNGTSDEMTEYTVEITPANLFLEINAANIIIKQGDSFKIESNLKHLKVEEDADDNALSVKEKSKFNYHSTDADLVLYIPKDHSFSTVEILGGAGKLSISELNTSNLQLTLGAGNFEADKLCIQNNCSIEGGVGKISIYDGTINNLDLEMGVGDLCITSSFYGICELDMGIGSSDLNLYKTDEGYRFNISKGIGSITLDGVAVPSGENSFGEGTTRINVSGGIGKISINTKGE